MLSSYQRQAIIEAIIEREGGAVVTDHPKDPGGLTKYGISQRAYPELKIRHLTRADAIHIYQRDYLIKYRLHELSNAQNAEIVMDWLVNGATIKRIQQAVGADPDGVIGTQTLRAIDTAPARDLLLARLDYYVSLVKHPFLKGWVNRLKHLGL